MSEKFDDRIKSKLNKKLRSRFIVLFIEYIYQRKKKNVEEWLQKYIAIVIFNFNNDIILKESKKSKRFLHISSE